MEKKYNPAKFGLTLQRLICEKYHLEENEIAKKQFDANYDEDYAEELRVIIPQIGKLIDSHPVKLLTYTKELINDKQTTSPHNFLLANGKTLSVRTTIGSGKVAPRAVGQAGENVLNDYFADIFGGEMKNQREVREMMYKNIHKALPIFIECFFPSDYNIIIERNMPMSDVLKLSLYKQSEISDYSFSRDEFTFTRGLNDWTESITLKYHNVSIAELQTHKNRHFKFRFHIKAIPEWFKLVKETNETFGITAEAAICDAFNLEKPDSFKTRASKQLQKDLSKIIEDAFLIIPKPLKHTGSETGERGESSKCSYDFELEGGLKLSLKTNKGDRVCPPEVGQPGAKTYLLYFKDFLPLGTVEVTNEQFKQMVFDKIECLMPIYISHLFDSDWLLWIYKTGNGYKFEAIHQGEINNNFNWEKDKFSFSKRNLNEWNESNTVKYNGESIGEFQVHNNRKCFKFRFHMPNILKLLRDK